MRTVCDKVDGILRIKTPSGTWAFETADMMAVYPVTCDSCCVLSETGAREIHIDLATSDVVIEAWMAP